MFLSIYPSLGVMRGQVVLERLDLLTVTLIHGLPPILLYIHTWMKWQNNKGQLKGCHWVMEHAHEYEDRCVVRDISL